MNRFALKIQKFFADEITDQAVRDEYGLNDFELVNSLFDVLKESTDHSVHLILDTIFLLAKV